MKSHTSKTISSLEKFEKLRKELPEFGNSMFQANKEKFYSFDFVAIGIIKRSVSVSTAIEDLVKNWNMTCARAVLRMQIDTALRLSAFWLVDNPHHLADKVMKGIPIKDCKDKTGEKMRDYYLKKKLGQNFEWVPKVYDYTSGYIHFSERHLFDPIRKTNKEERIVHFEVSERDEKFSEESWIELLDCAYETLQIILYYLTNYKKAKLDANKTGIGISSRSASRNPIL